jgi:hypothetical protein
MVTFPVHDVGVGGAALAAAGVGPSPEVTVFVVAVEPVARPLLVADHGTAQTGLGVSGGRIDE